MLSPDFSGFIIDDVLHKLIDSAKDPGYGYVDPRNCLVFWARPPGRIRGLVGWLQERLLGYAPSEYGSGLVLVRSTALLALLDLMITLTQGVGYYRSLAHAA